MIKPILKIELPNTISDEDRDKVDDMMKKSDAKNDYYIFVIYTDTSEPSFEIIIAPDASIHKP